MLTTSVSREGRGWVRVRCERCRKTMGRGKKEEVRRSKPATALKPLPEPQSQAGHAHEGHAAPPEPSVPPTGGLQISTCHTAQNQGTQSRAMPAHNSSGEICPLQSPVPQDSSEAPLQPPGRSAVTHRLSRPRGTSPSQGEPPRPNPSLTKRSEAPGEGRCQKYTRQPAAQRVGVDPRAGEHRLCAAEPFIPFGSLSPLTRGGRTRGRIASLLLQVAFSSSASSPELQEGRGAPAGAEDWCPAGTLPAPAPQPPNAPPAAPRDGIGAGILHDNAPVKARANRGFGRHLRLGQKSFFSGASEHEAGGHGIWATRRTSKCKAGKSHGVRTPQNKKDKSTGVRTPSACCEFPWGPRGRTATPSPAGAPLAEQDHACCPGFKTLKPSRHPSRGFSPTYTSRLTFP